jgi:hypothetical protein
MKCIVLDLLEVYNFDFGHFFIRGHFKKYKKIQNIGNLKKKFGPYMNFK